MSAFEPEITASDAVAEGILIYGNHTVCRQIPNVVDGLKTVHRRELWKSIGRKGYFKVRTLAGDTAAIHPHSDASVESSIVNFAKPWANIVPLYLSESGIGNYFGSAPAAGRYIDVTVAPVTRDLFFKNMSTVVYVPNEVDQNEEEPLNFIPSVPYALLSGAFGMPIGFKTETVTLNFDNLCKLTIEFIKAKMKDPINYKKHMSRHVHLLIPDFPSYCTLLNANELLKEYKAGHYEASILTEGELIVTPNAITIETIGYQQTTLLSYYDKLRDRIKAKDSITGTITNVANLLDKRHGFMRGSVEAELKRVTSPFNVLETVKQSFGFFSKWTPSMIYADRNNKISTYSPWDILDAWHCDRFKEENGDLRLKLAACIDRVRQLDALITVSGHAEEICKIFINAKSEAEACAILCPKFKLTPYQVGFLSKYQLGKLTEVGVNKLKEERKEVIEKHQFIRNELFRVNDRIIADIEAIRRKYANDYPRKCRIPKYIGSLCYKKDGFIQFESITEVDRLMRKLGSMDDIVLSLYPNKDNGVHVRRTGTEVSDNRMIEFSKWTQATSIEGTPHYVDDSTICLMPNGSIYHRLEKTTDVNAVMQLPSSKYVLMIDSKGGVEIVTPDTLPNKARAGVLPKSVTTYVYIAVLETNVANVVHGNSIESNHVKFETVKHGDKLNKQIIGDWVVITAQDASAKEMLFTIPQVVRSRCTIKFIWLADTSKFFKPGEVAKVPLLRKADGIEVVPMAKRSEIYVVK